MRAETPFRSRWWIVAGSTLSLIVGQGPVAFFTFGIFLIPVTTAFGWSRGAMSATIAVQAIVAAIATPIVGRMIDRYGARPVMLWLIALFSLSFAAIALSPPALIAFTLLYSVMAVFSAVQSPLPYAKVISAWFDDRRGLALGIAMAGVGIGVALVPQLARLLIDAFGWRGGYAGLGLATFIVAFPAVFLLIREPEASVAARRAGPSRAGAAPLPGLGVREAMTGSFRFAAIALAVFLAVTVLNGTIAHVVPMLVDRGVPREMATTVLSVVGISTIAGRLLSGYLLDRFFAPYVAAGAFLVPLAGLLLLGSGAGQPAPIIAVVCLGLSLGAEVDLIGYLTSRYFGLRCFGEIYGYLFAIFSIGTGIGPYLMGLCYDLTGSYDKAIAGFAILLLAASGLICRLGPYAFPVARRAPAPVVPRRQAASG